MLDASQITLFVLAVLVAFVAYIVYRQSLPQPLRPLQILMPVVALVYSVILLLAQGFLIAKMSSFIDWVGTNVPVFKNLITGTLTTVSACLVALVALLLFLVIKRVVFMIMEIIEREAPNTLLNRYRGTYGFAFEWKETGQMWSIKDEYRAMGKLSKWLYLVVLVVCSALLFLFPNSISLYSPCYGMLIFGEIACFLQAPPCTERKLNPGFDFEDGSTRVANYDLLTKAYKEFANRIVAIEKEEGRPQRKVANHAIVAPLLESELLEDNLAGRYLQSLQSLGEDLDSDKASMMCQLLQGKNVVCASPFYRDFGRYVLFPLVRALSHGQKAMVLCGSDVHLGDIIDWLNKEIGFVSGVEELWRVGSLFDCETDDELDVCCMYVNDANRQEELVAHEGFLKATRFVLLLNPSTSFSSAQVGLGLLARSLGNEHPVTYCIFDKNTNGLVDSLSHALRASFVEVECPRVPEGIVCSVVWKAEDPDGVSMHHQMFGEIAQYLGLGTEIASVAAKYGISNIVWTGEKNVPLQDMRWIGQQYYRKICAYADLDASASTIDDHIVYKNGMWDAQTEEHAFYIVEDEGANAFEVLRRFSTRGEEDSFINIISPNYLLRDYMSENSHMFLVDPKAVPHIVPDYANTLRNNALSLFARLSCGPVLESEIKKSLLLSEMGTTDVPSTLTMLASMYLNVDCSSEKLRGSIAGEDMLVGINPETLCYRRERFIKLSKGHPLEAVCKNILAQSVYVCEDEDLEKNVLGSCLTGHVYQNILPGQCLVLSGKYYEVLSISSGNAGSRVLLRRAADHFDKRVQYRQVRNVFMEDWRTSNRLNRTREYAGISFEMAEVDVVVSTQGYLEMDDLSDFKTARFVRMPAIPERVYRNKTALKISFADAPGVTPEIVATLTVLLNELFRTVYNENAKFLLVGSVCAQESDFPFGSYNQLETDALDEMAIYVLEDSNIDLGLIDSVDRNIIKFLGILEDYLAWHSERLLKELPPEEEEEEEEEELVLDIPDEILNIVVAVETLSLWERIKQWFFGFKSKQGGPDLGIVEEEKKKKGEEAEAPFVGDAFVNTESPLDAAGEALCDMPLPSEESSEGAEASEQPEEEHDPAAVPPPGVPTTPAPTPLAPGVPAVPAPGVPATLAPGVPATPAPDVPTVSVEGAEGAEGAADGEMEERDPYKRANFLKFGGEEYPASLVVAETEAFLNGLSVFSADLRQARRDADEREKQKLDEEEIVEDAHCCDFCGEPINTLEYDVLDDGRERCGRCTREAITSLDEFERVYAGVRRTMCALFNITLSSTVSISMTTADEIAKRTNSQFVATSGFDPRAVGVAIQEGKGKYTILIENGAPRISVIGTLAHELTHIWQYENWDEKKIVSEYGLKNKLAVYEGMAVWSEIQYLFASNNKTVAIRRLMNEIRRPDVYGAGLRCYYKKYGISMKPQKTLSKDHPFAHGDSPL